MGSSIHSSKYLNFQKSAYIIISEDLISNENYILKCMCFNLLLFTIYFKVLLLNMIHVLTIVIHYA